MSSGAQSHPDELQVIPMVPRPILMVPRGIPMVPKATPVMHRGIPIVPKSISVVPRSIPRVPRAIAMMLSSYPSAAPRHPEVWSNVMQCNATQCNAMRYNTFLCTTMHWHCIAALTVLVCRFLSVPAQFSVPRDWD